LDESTTFVYDAKDKVLGRLASKVAKQLLSARKSGAPNKVIIVNAEEAIVSGPVVEEMLFATLEL
jgi:ribosomal protein L13